MSRPDVAYTRIVGRNPFKCEVEDCEAPATYEACYGVTSSDGIDTYYLFVCNKHMPEGEK